MNNRKQITIATIAVTALASLLVSCASKQPARIVQPLNNIVIYATPVTSTGSITGCPGAYAGYASYTKTVANGWGWSPSTNTTTHTATDNNRSDTKVVYLGKLGDKGCAQTTVTVPDPAPSTVYRFTVYFPSSVPSTNYPLTLSGFNP